MWSNPRARAAVDCGETDTGDVREEIVVGYSCGGKPGSYRSKVILASHSWWVEPSPYLSPHTTAAAAEQYRGWSIK